jgi:hypothetical protein
MIRLVALVFVLLLVFALATVVVDLLRGRARRLAERLPRPAPRRRHYDWERRTDRAYRRLKSVPAPEEDRDRITEFLDSRAGVEAFVEPRTVMHPLSVVLVAGDGEWIRVALRDDAFLRELSRTRGLAVHDAMRVGYPERMRKYRRPPANGESQAEDA